jgi:hypothetical protein
MKSEQARWTAFADEMEKIAIGIPHVLAGGLIGLLLGARLWRDKDKKEQEQSEKEVVQRELPQMVGQLMPPGMEASPLTPPRNKINRMYDALRAYELEPEAGEVNPERDGLFFGKLGQAPGSLAHRAQLGAPGAWGSLGRPADAGGGAAPPAPSGPPGGGGGDDLGIPSGGPPGGGGGDLGIPGGNPGISGGGNPLGGAGGTPSASDLGIPSGGNPMGGGTPAGAGKAAEPPPATTAATGSPPVEATAAGRMAASQKASAQVQGSLGGGFQPGQAKGMSQSDLGIPD